MKMKIRKCFLILSALMVVFTSMAQPLTVKASSSHDWYKDGWDDIWYHDLRDSWNENLREFKCGVAGALASQFQGEPWYEGYLTGRVLTTNAEYYNQPSLVFDYVTNMYKDYPSQIKTDQPYAYAYQGFKDNSLNASNNNFIDDATYDYSTTTKYEVFQDNSDYSTNQYSFNWYNPITNNYNNCDTFYYDNSNNSYYYETNIGEINYENYVIDNSTHVTYYIVQTDTSTGVEYEFFYDIYYLLPDGRSSYDLTVEDVWGEYFVYNVVNYDSVAEDDGKTLGLWHLDGNGNDSSFWNNSTAVFGNLSYSDGVFGKGKYSNKDANTTYKLNLDKCSFDSSSPFTLEWVEYIPNNIPAQMTNSSIAGNSTFNEYTQYDYVYILPPKYTNSVQNNSMNSMALVFDGSNYSLFCNGMLCSYGEFGSSSISTICGFNITDDFISWSPSSICYYGDFVEVSSTLYETYYYYGYQHFDTIIDEIRLSRGCLYTGTYIPSAEPFTTNMVLVVPEDAKKNDIVIHSNYEVSDFRIGGVKPTFPIENYVYIALNDNDVVMSVQQYQVNKWVEVAGRVYLGNDTTEDLVGYNMSTFKVEEPDTSGDSSSGDSNDSDSGDSGDDSGFDFSELGKGFADLVNAIADLIGSALSSIGDLLNSVLDSLSVFTNFSSGFSNFLGQAFSFVPQEIWDIFGAGLSLLIIVGIVKMIRG